MIKYKFIFILILSIGCKDNSKSMAKYHSIIFHGKDTLVWGKGVYRKKGTDTIYISNKGQQQ